MAEYIEREAAYETLTEYYHHSTEIQHDALKEALHRVPAADVAPVRHGYWRHYLTTKSGGKLFVCSECDGDSMTVHEKARYGYCPNCGARMDGES